MAYKYVRRFYGHFHCTNPQIHTSFNGYSPCVAESTS